MKFLRPHILLVALFVTGWAGEAAPMGVAVNGERLAVIDMHLHTGTWAGTPPRFRKRLTDRVPTGFKWTMGVFMNSRLDGESILDTLDDAGISAGAVFALWSPPTTGIATNEHVAKQVAVNPDRLFGFASLRVDHWNQDGPEQLRQMEEAIEKHGMVGIKLAHGHQQVRLDDERLYGVYEIAARQGHADLPAHRHQPESGHAAPNRRIAIPLTWRTPYSGIRVRYSYSVTPATTVSTGR